MTNRDFWLTDLDAWTKLLIPAKTGRMVSGAARNFIREAPVTCCLTDCFFRIFRTVEITITHHSKFVLGGMASSASCWLWYCIWHAYR